MTPQLKLPRPQPSVQSNCAAVIAHYVDKVQRAGLERLWLATAPEGSPWDAGALAAVNAGWGHLLKIWDYHPDCPSLSVRHEDSGHYNLHLITRKDTPRFGESSVAWRSATGGDIRFLARPAYNLPKILKYLLWCQECNAVDCIHRPLKDHTTFVQPLDKFQPEKTLSSLPARARAARTPEGASSPRPAAVTTIHDLLATLPQLPCRGGCGTTTAHGWECLPCRSRSLS